MISDIFFDLDGTLFDTLEDICAAVQETFLALCLQPPELPRIRRALGHGTYRLFSALLQGSGVPVERALPIFTTRYLARIDCLTRFYPHVKGVITTLRALGYGIHILTNKPRVYTHALLRALSVSPMFDLVITPDDMLGIAKPDARIRDFAWFRPASVMVGDSAVDMAFAKRCGLPGVFVAYGYGNAEAPDYTIRDMRELLALPLLAGATPKSS